jgi:30S ribosomal protein S31
MGKGDKRSRRGKIFAGTFGKSRPKRKRTVVTAPPVEEAKPVKKTRKKA